MKRDFRRTRNTAGALLSVALLVACARQSPIPAPQPMPELGLRTLNVVRGDSTRYTIAERLRHYNVPGVSVAVIDRGRIAWARGFGDKVAGSGARVDTATLFQAASISKPVAAAAALQLVQDGVLRLDDDVSVGLKSWQLPASAHTATEKVTLRRLLSHTGGTTVSGFPGYAAGVTVPSVVQVLTGGAPANTPAIVVDVVPGGPWRYSGGGYTIAQVLMSDVTGNAFPQLMKQRVLDRVGMRRSTYVQPLAAERVHEAAAAHRADGTPIPGHSHTYPEMAAAGLWTTPSDLARFAIAMQRAVSGLPNGLGLTATTARSMITPVHNNYGLGFSIAGTGDSAWFSHGGSNAGFRANLVASADGRYGAVIMTNGDRGGELIGEIMRAIAHEYDWPRHRAVERDEVVLDSAALAPYIGRYQPTDPNAPGGRPVITIELVDGRLRSTVAPGTWRQREMRASAPDRFFHLVSPVEFAFERDAAGRVTGAVLTGVAATPVRVARLP